jgi:ADP-sugar diphosphatase
MAINVAIIAILRLAIKDLTINNLALLLPRQVRVERTRRSFLHEALAGILFLGFLVRTTVDTILFSLSDILPPPNLNKSIHKMALKQENALAVSVSRAILARQIVRNLAMTNDAARTIIFEDGLGQDQREVVLRSPKVVDWLRNIYKSANVESISFDKVYMFGKPPNERVGYIVANVLATTLDGRPLPSITLIRGDSVAVLLVLRNEDTGEDFTVVVCQPRLSIGDAAFCEIPAGMVDGDDNFVSTAIRELQEEVGELSVSRHDLTPLQRIYPSPGGCDESIQIFSALKPLPAKVIEALQGKQTGAADENEAIKIRVVPLHDLPFAAPHDMKAQLGYLTYCAINGLAPNLQIGPGVPERAANSPGF